MTDLPRSRVGRSFALTSPKLTLRRLFEWFRPAPRGLDIKKISDHLARDIGLSATELERRRLELPSQTTYHPRG